MLSLAAALPAQISNVLTVEPGKTTGKRGQTMVAELTLQLRPGYHVNSNKPADPYLIPLKFSWAENPGLQPVTVDFPAPKMERYEFSDKPLSVFTGDVKVKAQFKVAPNAPLGQSVVGGKLRYQACNDKMCLPPKSIDVKIPVTIAN
jgi:DsbC/DsbD-like thiol-disulfide interchange protein